MMTIAQKKHKKTRVTLDFFGRIAKQEGYEIVPGQKYTKSRMPLLWRCPNNHRWACSWDNWKQGHRCRQCYFERPKLTKHTLESIRKHIESEGYVLLSDDYKNPHTKIRIRCSRGHQYLAMWMQFQRGERCRKCQFEMINIGEVCRRLGKEGYQLISTKYRNSHTKMESVCPKGHIWYFAWAEFKKGYRCKYCKIRPSKGESELGKVLKEIFGADRVRRQSNLGFLERQTVDYFICDLNLAFEYDGEQHFFPVRYGNRSIKQAKEDFEKQQIRDQRKDLLCQRNGIRLIRFSYKEKITRNLIENKVENLIEDKVGG